MRPRAIVWDLFGDHLRYIDGGQVQMRALTELLGVFNVSESTTRVVLSRMRREGWFTTSRDGRQTSYAPTAQSVRMLDEGRSRIFDRGRGDWDATWRMVIYAEPEESRAERDQVRRTLAWHGFGPLAASTWISSHPRLDTVASALAAMSATRSRPGRRRRARRRRPGRSRCRWRAPLPELHRRLLRSSHEEDLAAPH